MVESAPVAGVTVQEARHRLFSHFSRRSTSRIRLEIGTVSISIDDKGDGRATVGVSHDKLETPSDVELWKPFWADWLEALDAT